MNDLDPRVRELVHDLAGDAPDGNELWAKTARRISVRRRRRVAAAGAAITVVLATIVGVIVSRDDSPVGHIDVGPVGTGETVATAPDETEAAPSSTTSSTVSPTTTEPGQVPTVVVVPDLLGMTSTEAADVLTELGANVEIATIGAVEDTPGSTVIWQEPPAGARLIPAGSVRLWVCGATARCVSPPPSYVDELPRTTQWRSVDLTAELWSGLGAGSPEASPAALLESVGDALVGDNNTEVVTTSSVDVARQSGVDAEVWLRLRGLPDDSVSGQDYRVTFESAGSTWRVVGAEVRDLCARGEYASAPALCV